MDKFTPEQIAEFQDAFSLFDKDNSGTISCEELGTVIRSLGHVPTDKELRLMVMRADKDGNGEVDFAEFLELMAEKLEGEDPDREIKDAWAVFSDGNKFIPRQMIKLIMHNLGENLNEEQVENLVAEADYDGDGEINYDDFYKTMKATRAAPGASAKAGASIRQASTNDDQDDAKVL